MHRKICLVFFNLGEVELWILQAPSFAKRNRIPDQTSESLQKKSIKSESCNTTRKSFKKGQLLLIKNNLSRDCVVMHMFMYYKLVTVLQHGFIVVNNFPKEWPLSVFQQNSIMVYFYEGRHDEIVLTRFYSSRKREKSNSR